MKKHGSFTEILNMIKQYPLIFICSRLPVFFLIGITFFHSFSAFAELSELNPVFESPVVESNSATFWKIAETLNRRKLFENRFKQEKHIKVLKRPLVSSGTIVFSAKHGLCWETKTPFTSTLSITVNGIYQRMAGESFRPVAADKHGVASDITSVFLAVFSGDRKILEQNFDMYLLGTASKWTIGLRPKQRILKMILKAIVLKGSTTITAIELWEDNGDRALIEFYDQETDVETLAKRESDCFSF